MRVRYSQDAQGNKIKRALVYTASEHTISPKNIDAEALKIIQTLHSAGYEGFIVGGAVRDLLLGRIPKDFDIATSAEPSKIKKLFRNSRIIGKRFRLVHIFYGPKIYEISTFRSIEDGAVGNKFGTIEEDVQRRDFTINALYYDPIKNLIIDYVGGLHDLRKNRLRAIIPLKNIFSEDPVRMLRAIKYSILAKAKIPFLLSCRLHRDTSLLEYCSPSRLTEELNKIFHSGYSKPIIERLLHYELFLYLQPSAYSFIQDNAKFAECFLSGFEELDSLTNEGKIQRQGQALVFLLRDFINLITDWEGSPGEVYAFVYQECRHFVLPMNPQRIELEYAVRYCLYKGGLKIRPPRPLQPKTTPVKRLRTRTQKGQVGKTSQLRGVHAKSSPTAKKKALSNKSEE
ncbi:polynucleotide adenylyltransferase PcnB [Treponema phagedenis]|uniref:Poly(A) polymerase n=1 Tax=Treponema phagedenis TaxID=162 RepID=A0A0B7GWZ2_TREPH|nr:polynucleotide adenylyltransferase PcnB [Treponema phagedenis]QEJ94491.1 polynucleotide adenylyltransferase PcnB [Treponema phagedenis]QEJ97564.1 polynucleotide adenylyltransferase PcnB [Treponema phagedenis]QEK01627.1 polynucleotide adenylyltransferase PcnB [Treponema phagedenis]QEK03131.1 polynucleotide adenylyltransferase PcnB [Treponema phagedenis]QEK06750.1 polynucleotide adenylyltransferase PcnB [Treponema phagedenis]